MPQMNSWVAAKVGEGLESCAVKSSVARSSSRDLVRGERSRCVENGNS
jgi:hypothetical protein